MELDLDALSEGHLYAVGRIGEAFVIIEPARRKHGHFFVGCATPSGDAWHTKSPIPKDQVSGAITELKEAGFDAAQATWELKSTGALRTYQA